MEEATIQLPDKLAHLTEVYAEESPMEFARALEKLFEEYGEPIPKLCPDCAEVTAWSTDGDHYCGSCEQHVEPEEARAYAELLAE